MENENEKNDTEFEYLRKLDDSGYKVIMIGI